MSIRKGQLLCLLIPLLSGFRAYSQTDEWTRKANFPGSGRVWAIGFSIGSKGYAGTGGNAGGRLNDFWEYDPATDTWTMKADVPGTRSAGVGFSIGSKGYAGAGSATAQNDFYVYDPATNQWSPIASLPGPVRYLRSVGAGTSTRGYVGLGLEATTDSVLHDFWEYNPDSNTWTRKADYPGKGGAGAVSFTIGDKVYVGTGSDAKTGYYDKEFYAYDPVTDTWAKKANIGSGRWGGIAFSIGTMGYVGTGYVPGSGITNDLWEYNSLTNVWTIVTPCSIDGFTTFGAIGFSIGNRGYLSMGTNGPNTYSSDLFEYNLNTGITNPAADYFSLYPSPCNGTCSIRSSVARGTCSITDLTGRLVFEKELQNNITTINTGLPAGVYIVTVSGNDSDKSVRKLVVN